MKGGRRSESSAYCWFCSMIEGRAYSTFWAVPGKSAVCRRCSHAVPITRSHHVTLESRGEFTVVAPLSSLLAAVSCVKRKARCHNGSQEIVRAACLQNETAPKSFNFKTKNGPKNAPKLPRKMLSLVLLCRISHRHYSKIFHREFPHKIKYFFTTRICRHGHAKNCHKRVAPLTQLLSTLAGLKGGNLLMEGGGVIRMWLPVHCLSAPPVRQPVQCRRGASQRHRIVIPDAMPIFVTACLLTSV